MLLSSPMTLTFYAETLYIRHRIALVAVEYPASRLTFVMSDAKEFKDELERFGLEDAKDKNDEQEIQVGVIGADGEMYPLRTKERVTSAVIKQFAEDFLAGKLTFETPRSSNDVSSIVYRNVSLLCRKSGAFL